MDSRKIVELFDKFFEEQGHDAYKKISLFLDQMRTQYYEESQHATPDKRRNAWVSTVGRALEDIISKIATEFCKANNLAWTRDNDLKNPKTETLERVRRNILVYFGDTPVLPDGDIIIYCPQNYEVIAILSIKNSFRERYTETPYWKLKLMQNPTTRHIRVFMVTPDRNDEVSFTNRGKKSSRKARIVMEYELDGIYLAKEDFDPSEKVKSIADLISDLEHLLNERPCSS